MVDMSVVMDSMCTTVVVASSLRIFYPFHSTFLSSNKNTGTGTGSRLMRIPAYSKPLVATTASHPDKTEDATTISTLAKDEEKICSTCLSNGKGNGRRGFIFLTTTMLGIPLLQTPQQSDASTQFIDTDESSIIRIELKKVLSKAKAAGMLRLAFHDAGTFNLNAKTGGMNGSIVYELDRPENAGLKKPIKVLTKVKTELDKVLQVSWADMIAVAGSEAVSLCGGPLIPVQVGRIDARIADPEGRLPLESLDASGLKRCFLEKGFSTQELVALSGAHTLGSKGFGSPIVFDNSYFKILLEKPWTSPGGMSSMIGLPSDRALVEDNECLRWITIYAEDQFKFFVDFKNAYMKLVNSGAMWRQTTT